MYPSGNSFGEIEGELLQPKIKKTENKHKYIDLIKITAHFFQRQQTSIELLYLSPSLLFKLNFNNDRAKPADRIQAALQPYHSKNEHVFFNLMST